MVIVMLLMMKLFDVYLGKEVLMILVEYLFGVVDLVYCYYVDVFVYVVEGLIVM